MLLGKMASPHNGSRVDSGDSHGSHHSHEGLAEGAAPAAIPSTPRAPPNVPSLPAGSFKNEGSITSAPEPSSGSARSRSKTKGVAKRRGTMAGGGPKPLGGTVMISGLFNGPNPTGIEEEAFFHAVWALQAEVPAASLSPERGAHGSVSPAGGHGRHRGTPRWKKVVCMTPKERFASRKLVNSETKNSGLAENLEVRLNQRRC